MFSVDVLDITDEQIIGQFQIALSKVAALSLELGYPTQASLPHSIGNAFKSLIAIAVNLDTYSFKEAEPYKAFLADPSAFAVAAPAGGAAAPAAAGGAAAAAPAPEKPKEEEVDALDGGMDMFGGGGGGGDY